jgi:hypothetical protein
MDSLYALSVCRIAGRFYMQVAAEQERDEACGVAAFCRVPVRLQFLRLAALEEAFPLERNQPPQALQGVPVVDMPLLMGNDGALLQFGEPVKRVTELDSAP